MTVPKSITVGTTAVFVKTRAGLKLCAAERVLDLEWLAEKCGVVAEGVAGWEELLLRAAVRGEALPPVFDVAVTLVVTELPPAEAAAWWIEARQTLDDDERSER